MGDSEAGARPSYYLTVHRLASEGCFIAVAKAPGTLAYAERPLALPCQCTDVKLCVIREYGL